MRDIKPNHNPFDLLTCPFCGNNDLSVSYTANADGGGSRVHCEGCGAIGPDNGTPGWNSRSCNLHGSNTGEIDFPPPIEEDAAEFEPIAATIRHQGKVLDKFTQDLTKAHKNFAKHWAQSRNSELIILYERVINPRTEK